MKKYLYLLFFISFQSFAQTTTINGIVKDKETLQPVEDVVVSIEKTNSHTHTDEAGKFSFLSLSDSS